MCPALLGQVLGGHGALFREIAGARTGVCQDEGFGAIGGVRRRGPSDRPDTHFDLAAQALQIARIHIVRTLKMRVQFAEPRERRAETDRQHRMAGHEGFDDVEMLAQMALARFGRPRINWLVTADMPSNSTNSAA